MTTFERIKFLAEKQKKSLNKIEEELGYGRNVLYRLKNSSPSTERLIELANYFDVTTDYLLCRTDEQSTTYSNELMEAVKMLIDRDNPDFTEIIEKLTLLDSNEIKVVKDMVNSLVSLKQKKS